MTSTDRAAVARRSVRRGKESEQAVARHLRLFWPDARRRIATAWTTEQATQPDTGDIDGCPGLVWQVKAATHLPDGKLTEALTQTEQQALAAGADYGLLVQRRHAVADPARWWAWLPIIDLGTLCGAPPLFEQHARHPARTELRHVVALLLRCGYGGPER